MNIANASALVFALPGPCSPFPVGSIRVFAIESCAPYSLLWTNIGLQINVCWNRPVNLSSQQVWSWLLSWLCSFQGHFWAITRMHACVHLPCSAGVYFVVGFYPIFNTLISISQLICISTKPKAFSPSCLSCRFDFSRFNLQLLPFFFRLGLRNCNFFFFQCRCFDILN